ncbi:MAG: tetratricopeptide repeat protein [Gemmatimonadales bacterium]
MARALLVVPTALSALLLIAGGVPSSVPGNPRAAAPTDSITFARDVAPIFYRHCAACHRAEDEGGSAPFSLMRYEDAAPRAALIAAAVASRRMPPWLPERAPGDVTFAGERRLSADEIGVIRRWAAQGAARGDSADLPRAPTWPDGWQLGEPHVVIEFPAYAVPAGGVERYRNLVVAAPVQAPWWVGAVELRPGNPRVVHHARLMVDTTASSARADAQDAGPGFDGMELRSDARSPAGFFVGWTPGKVPGRYPAGFAWRLAPGTDLVLQLHIRPHASGAGEVLRPRLGLYFTDRPPRRPSALVMLGTKTIDIPPDDSAYVVTDSYELPVAVEVLGVYPHAHYLATRMEGVARLPDGKVQRLLRIAAWDFNWQDEYRYAAPVRLPQGSVLSMRYTYDNSAANPRNPSRPPRRVQYGPHSTDEMADLVFQVVPLRAADVAVLERDLGWKYYAEQVTSDAYRAFSRGREQVSAGRLDEAVALFRESLGLRADDARVHEELGAVLAAQGNVAEAIAHFEQAVALAEAAGQHELAARIRRRLEGYRTERPR